MKVRRASHTWAAFAVAAIALASVSTASAETRRYNTGGAAQGVGKDVRTQALDKAFAAAVTEALADVMATTQRKKHWPTLRDKVVRRARIFVSGYRVLDERSVEGELRVQISASIDLAKLRSKVSELGIDINPGQAPSFGGTRPKVAVILKVSLGEATETTFGSTGSDGGATGRAITKHLVEHGFEVVSVVGKQAPLGGQTEAGVPLDDGAATELARAAGAGGAIVVGVGAAFEGRIRGTKLLGSTATATVRVIDVSSDEIVARTAEKGAGFGIDLARAHGHAAGAAADKLLAKITPRLERYWPAKAKGPQGQGIAVEFTGARSWAPVGRVIRHLGQNKSVRAVHPISVRAGSVRLSVDTELSAKRLAALVGGANVGSARLSARVKDGAVVVKVSGSVQ